jgi:hypothetical protein
MQHIYCILFSALYDHMLYGCSVGLGSAGQRMLGGFQCVGRMRRFGMGMD